VLALGDDDDVVGREGRRLGRILDLDEVLFEIHQQPLLVERVDPDQAFAAKIDFAQGREHEVADRGRPDGQRIDLHPVDDVARRRGVQDRGGAERKLEIVRNPQADGRGVGAAVDDEVIGPAAVHQHVDVEPRVGLARLDVRAADVERRVDHRWGQRRDVGRDCGGRRRRLADHGRDGRRPGIAGDARHQQPERQDQGSATHGHSASPQPDSYAVYREPGLSFHAILDARRACSTAEGSANSERSRF